MSRVTIVNLCAVFLFVSVYTAAGYDNRRDKRASHYEWPAPYRDTSQKLSSDHNRQRRQADQGNRSWNNNGYQEQQYQNEQPQKDTYNNGNDFYNGENARDNYDSYSSYNNRPYKPPRESNNFQSGYDRGPPPLPPDRKPWDNDYHSRDQFDHGRGRPPPRHYEGKSYDEGPPPPPRHRPPPYDHRPPHFERRSFRDEHDYPPPPHHGPYGHRPPPPPPDGRGPPHHDHPPFHGPPQHHGPPHDDYPPPPPPDGRGPPDHDRPPYHGPPHHHGPPHDDYPPPPPRDSRGRDYPPGPPHHYHGPPPDERSPYSHRPPPPDHGPPPNRPPSPPHDRYDYGSLLTDNRRPSINEPYPPPRDYRNNTNSPSYDATITFPIERQDVLTTTKNTHNSFSSSNTPSRDIRDSNDDDTEPVIGSERKPDPIPNSPVYLIDERFGSLKEPKSTSDMPAVPFQPQFQVPLFYQVTPVTPEDD